MTKVLRSVVTGVGGYLPDEIVTNTDLAQVVDTSDEWIIERTGIRQRHRAAKDQPVSDLAVKAARIALEAAGKTPELSRKVMKPMAAVPSLRYSSSV